MKSLVSKAVILICVFTVAGTVICCPALPLVDIQKGEKIDVGAKSIVVSYFEASKKGDAKTASSLIDYEEWAKDMNLDGDRKKDWIEMHRGTLQDDYDQHKKDGSTKNYKIIESEIKGNEATFEVSQERTTGTYVWEVKLIRKNNERKFGNRWRIKGFYPKRIEGSDRIFQFED